LALGIAAWVWHRRQIQSTERVVFGAMLLFLAGVGYEGCAMVLRNAASRWPVQSLVHAGLLVPAMRLVCLGLSRWKRVGHLLAGAMVALWWAWILVRHLDAQAVPDVCGRRISPCARGMCGDGGRMGRRRTRTEFSLTALAPAPCCTGDGGIGRAHGGGWGWPDFGRW